MPRISLLVVCQWSLATWSALVAQDGPTGPLGAYATRVVVQEVFKFELDFVRETRTDVLVSPSKTVLVTSTFAPSGQSGPTGHDALTVTLNKTKHVEKEKDSDFVVRRTVVLARLLNTIRYTRDTETKIKLTKVWLCSGTWWKWSQTQRITDWLWDWDWDSIRSRRQSSYASFGSQKRDPN